MCWLDSVGYVTMGYDAIRYCPGQILSDWFPCVPIGYNVLAYRFGSIRFDKFRLDSLMVWYDTILFYRLRFYMV